MLDKYTSPEGQAVVTAHRSVSDQIHTELVKQWGTPVDNKMPAEMVLYLDHVVKDLHKQGLSTIEAQEQGLTALNKYYDESEVHNETH